MVKKQRRTEMRACVVRMRRASFTVLVSLGLVLAAASSRGDSAQNVFGQCIVPLGMEEGKIPDDAITASSSYETKSVGPQNARIRQEKNGGAWCPKAQISSAIREYLEIDLTRNHLIAWTETQGRFGNGQGQEYAEAFFLEYWRGAKWHQYKDLKGDRVLRGNSNTYLVEKQKLDLPFIGSRVRFVPYSQHPRTVCMRVEIYGCIWEEYVASYSAPTPSNPGPEGCDVLDSSYDGVQDDALLTEGLGQLTDGILGDPTEIRFSSTSIGTNWVGWSERATVELLFRFQELREFENCTVHVARVPAIGVEIFSTGRVWFSVDGERYDEEEEKFETPIDANVSSVPAGVSISIPLQFKIGRLVKLELSLSATWLLVSEVTFHTVRRNRSSDSYFLPDSNAGTGGVVEGNEIFEDDVPRSPSDGNETRVSETPRDKSKPDAFPVGTSQTYIGLASGLLTVVALLFTCTAFLLKQRGRNKVALLQKHTALLCDSSAPGISATGSKDRKLSNSIVNGLSLIRKPIGIAVADGLPERVPVQSNSRSTIAESDYRRRSTVYERTYRLFSEEALVLGEANGVVLANDYQRGSSFSRKKRGESTMSTSNASRKINEGFYAATDILSIKTRDLPSSPLSPFTPLRIRENSVHLQARPTDLFDIPRVSRHSLRIVDKLGEGNFGLIHVCEAKGIVAKEIVAKGIAAKGIVANPETETMQDRQTVIVRSLWRGVMDAIRLEFTEDMRMLAGLRHQNVARMIALVEEEPFGAAFEYGQFGDLPGFLESYGFSDDKADTSDHGSPLNFVIQIASGMKYLESMCIAHCDLAARNCIVGQQLTIKVSDHAVFCSKYDRHYFVDGSNVKIPLRWMAWDAVLMGKRTSRADVWSFAVTVWEIFTNCRQIPYPDLTSTQVLENCNRWCREETNAKDEGSRPRVPPQPDRCSNNVYRLMNRCWVKRAEDRPTFEEIHRYLEMLTND